MRPCLCCVWTKEKRGDEFGAVGIRISCMEITHMGFGLYKIMEG